MCNMLGLGDMNADQLASKLEETLPVIRSVSEQFKDPASTLQRWGWEGVLQLGGTVEWSSVSYLTPGRQKLSEFWWKLLTVSAHSLW